MIVANNTIVLPNLETIISATVKCGSVSKLCTYPLGNRKSNNQQQDPCGISHRLHLLGVYRDKPTTTSKKKIFSHAFLHVIPAYLRLRRHVFKIEIVFSTYCSVFVTANILLIAAFAVISNTMRCDKLGCIQIHAVQKEYDT